MRADVSTRKFSDSSVKGMGGGKPRDTAAYLHGYTQARTCAHTQGTQGPLTALGHPLQRLASICWGCGHRPDGTGVVPKAPPARASLPGPFFPLSEESTLGTRLGPQDGGGQQPSQTPGPPTDLCS